MAKKVLKEMAKDIGMFSLGSMTLGAGARAVAPFGAPYGAGLSTMGQMMRPVAGITMMKAQVGMLSEAAKLLPKPKRYKRR